MNNFRNDMFINPVDEGQPVKPAYKHQDWPRVMYGPLGKEKLVPDQKTADALGPDWHKTPPLPAKDEDEAGPARDAEVRQSSKKAAKK